MLPLCLSCAALPACCFYCYDSRRLTSLPLFLPLMQLALFREPVSRATSVFYFYGNKNRREKMTSKEKKRVPSVDHAIVPSDAQAVR